MVGDYCKRTNTNGVDLNRNWNDHWKESAKGGQEGVYGGDRVFSEDETTIIKASLLVSLFDFLLPFNKNNKNEKSIFLGVSI